MKSDKKIYYEKLIMLGVPIMLQNLIGIGLNLLDTIMIGLVGETELAAVGAANQVYFVYSVTLFGLLSGSAVYTAQYFGSKNKKSIKHVVGMGYLLALLSSVFVVIAVNVFTKQIIGLYSKSPEVLSVATSYIRIASLSYPFAALSFVISYNSRAIQRVNIPTIINGIAMGINAFLNWTFIFGHFGFSAIGVRGAAYGTLIARIFELVALILYVYTREDHIFKASFRELFGFSKQLFNRVMKTAIPVILSEGCWALSTALVFAVYGKLGTSALAVTQAANVIADLLVATYFGVGNATAMLVGEVLGKENRKAAYEYGKYAIWAVAVLNIVVTIVMIAISPLVAKIYGFSPETSDLLIRTIKMMGLITTPEMFAYIFAVGILRGGGDTTFCMITEAVGNMLLKLPCVYVAVRFMGLDLPMAIAMGEIGDIIKIGLFVPRFRSKKWINVVK